MYSHSLKLPHLFTSLFERVVDRDQTGIQGDK